MSANKPPSWRVAATLYYDMAADANSRCIAEHGMSKTQARGGDFEAAFANLKRKLHELYGQMPQDPAIPADLGGWRQNF